MAKRKNHEMDGKLEVKRHKKVESCNEGHDQSMINVDTNNGFCEISQYRSNLPYNLLKLMYQIDLSILFSIRKSVLKYRYPSMSIEVEGQEILNFNNIILHYDKKITCINVEYVDKYYIDIAIGYGQLFTKKKQSLSINTYFNSFVKYLISRTVLSEIEHLVLYSNADLDLTRDNELKAGKFRYYYPFKLSIMNIKNADVLRDFLSSKYDKSQMFYQFGKDKTTRTELMKRLKLSPLLQACIKQKKIHCKFDEEKVKNTFLDKLVFAVNQPEREKLSYIIELEMEENNQLQNKYMVLLEKKITYLTSWQKYRSNNTAYVVSCLYNFSLLMNFLHVMWLHENIFSINIHTRVNQLNNDIIVNYRNRKTYVTVHNTNISIDYCMLFPSQRRNTFSLNDQFAFYIEILNSDVRYFIVYSNVELSLTINNILRRGESKEFFPLKFDRLDIQKRKYKILRKFSFINENGLYQFACEEATRDKLMELLKIPCSLHNKRDGISYASEKQIKENFLKKLIFAVEQPNVTKLRSIAKYYLTKRDSSDEIPFNYRELHEVALRWSESHEYGPITKELILEILKKMKNNEFNSCNISNIDISTEVKIAKGAVGVNNLYSFHQFLDFLIKGEGKKFLQVLKSKGISVSHISSILHKAGPGAPRVFKDLFNLWFDEQDKETRYFKVFQEKGIKLSNLSGILGRSGVTAVRAFKELYDLWFDEEGNKKEYLKVLEKNKISFNHISSILNRTGVYAAKAFKDLYDLWFDKEGNKTYYLKNFEENNINLSNLSNLMCVSGIDAAKTFKNLYDMWFDVNGHKKSCLENLNKEGINLASFCSILHGAGSNAPGAFQNLYDLWFDKKGDKKKYLNTLEHQDIDLLNISSILTGAGIDAAKAYKALFDSFFDNEGNRSQRLKNFIENKYGISFTMRNLSGILSRSGAKAKDAFEKLHDICFIGDGKRTKLLDDFFNAGFKPSNLSAMLNGTGNRAASFLERFHNVCFNKEGGTKFLQDFYNIGFKPSHIGSSISGISNDLGEFHYFFFVGETKKYLYHFSQENLPLKNLSRILSGTRANACTTLREFHDVCFDESGNKTDILKDFYSVGFTLNDLVILLSSSGSSVVSNLKNFHVSCFNEKNRLHHMLIEKEIFTPVVLSRMLSRLGKKISLTFLKLHDLCFDTTGMKTDYLNELIQNNKPNKVIDILQKKVKLKA